MSFKPLGPMVAVLTTALVALPVHGPAASGAGETAADEVARLQGDWTMVSLEINGYKADDDQVRGWLLVVEGDQYNPGSGERSMTYTFRLDPTRCPRAIDLIPASDPYRGKVFRGVYALEGDLFTVCRPLDPDGDRPAGLTSRRHSGLARVVWKRRKP